MLPAAAANLKDENSNDSLASKIRRKSSSTTSDSISSRLGLQNVNLDLGFETLGFNFASPPADKIAPVVAENLGQGQQGQIPSHTYQQPELVNYDDDQNKQCWVCFATPEEDRYAPWVRPCRCRGTTKWVHRQCVLRWIDEKQAGDTFLKVYCSSCRAEYLILYPPFGPAANFLFGFERFMRIAGPFLSFVVISGTWYLLARRHMRYYTETEGVVLYGDVAMDNAVSVFARISLCLDSSNTCLQTLSTLTLPLIAVWLFTDRVEPPMTRYFLGGSCLALLTARAVCYTFKRYQQTWRRKQRLIVEYTDDEEQAEIEALTPSAGELPINQ